MEQSKITEALALGTMLKLSRTAVKRAKLDEAIKNGVLNALSRFGSEFLPESEFKPEIGGDGTCVTPYEMAYRIVSSSDNTELKALWYVFYPYLVVASPHIDETLYEETKKILCDEKILDAVLRSRYRELVYDCAEDLQAAGLAGVYTEWYAPYTEYKHEPVENGTRETENYKKLLAAGDFDAVITGTDRMLNYNPYDVDVALLNIAARVSRLSGGAGERRAELGETTEFIDGYITNCDNDRQLTYLHYYKAMCLLGLAASGTPIESAKEEFQKCLSITPNFELATFMLKALETKLGG